MHRSYSISVYSIFLLILFAGVLGLPFSAPILMLLLPAFYLSTFISAEPWERLTFVPLIVLGLSIDLVFGSIIAHSYSGGMAKIIVGVLNIGSIFGLYKSNSRNWFALPRSDKKVSRSYWIPLGILGLILSLLIFYGMLVSFPSFWSGPYCAYGQRGIEIMRTGNFHLLENYQSCFNAIPFFYPPAFPSLIAWISTVVPVESVNSSLGYVAPLFLVSLCGIFLSIGYRMGWPASVSLLTLLLLLPSYAIFVIFTHIDSDTPGLACSALFLYLMIRLQQNKKFHISLWWALLATWGLSWWIRSYLGLIFTFLLIVLFIFSQPLRKALLQPFRSSKNLLKRPIHVAGLFLIILIGPFWEWAMWAHTGSPLAPFSVAPMGLKIAEMKDEFHFYEPETIEDEEASDPSKLEFYLKEFMYDFFPVVTDEGWKKNVFKSGRAVFHGNTFSILWSLLLLIGLIIGARRMRKEGACSPSLVAFLMILGVVLIFATNTYYRKILYAGFPAMMFFVALALNEFDKRWVRISKYVFVSLSGVLGIVFVFSYFYAGVGTWPADRRWDILKTNFRSLDDREELRNGFSLSPVVNALKDIPKHEKFLYFHLEPGITLSYALDRRPFWEEHHYESQKLAGLHKLDTREKVLTALKSLNINYLVFTYQFERFFNRTEPEILPRMIYENDPALELLAHDSNEVFRVYRVKSNH